MKNSLSHITPYFMTSANQILTLLKAKFLKYLNQQVQVSAGKAPTRFSFGVINSYFPTYTTIDLGQGVVGTCINGTRMYVAATKPAKSPLTPPPRAIMGDFRSSPASNA